MAEPAPRLGIGFDSHARDPERPLMLAGVRFDDEPGLAGHSDADVVCHALGDALLGACALGDLGDHFPDTDPRWAALAGVELLGRVVEVVRARGFAPESCDIVVVADGPSIATRRDEMREVLADVLGTGVDRVSIKGKRPEGLSVTGGAIACLALAVVSG